MKRGGESPRHMHHRALRCVTHMILLGPKVVFLQQLLFCMSEHFRKEMAMLKELEVSGDVMTMNM